MTVSAVEITCPACGTVSQFQEVGRDAGAFCPACDYPLFWARGDRRQGNEDGESQVGLRRLPGTVGRVSEATLDCPVCAEPNLLTASVCVRCGALLHPAPPEPEVDPLPPPPEPEPEPAPVVVVEEATPARVIWPWVLCAVLAVAAVVILVVLLV